MFRAVEDEALVNRMGFNNAGAQAMAARLENWRASGFWPGHPVGINLGKSKITPLENATEDYLQSFQVLWPWADFFVVNVSSPNTPNLRELQEKAALSEIIHALQAANRHLSGKSVSGRARPILIKVAPDLTDLALDDVLEVAEESGVAGIVATNTTIERPLPSSETAREIYAQTGGLSGKPLRARSTAVIRYIFERTGGFMPIIGVGGIFSAEDAWEKIISGASLVQIYTGLVYEGPGLAGAIVRGVMERMEEAGISNMAEATGSDVD
jgi:dihydroorotate dehydrogenase